MFPDKSIQAFFAGVTHWPIRVRMSVKWKMWPASSAGGKGPVVSLSIKTHKLSECLLFNFHLHVMVFITRVWDVDEKKMKNKVYSLKGF